MQLINMTNKSKNSKKAKQTDTYKLACKIEECKNAKQVGSVIIHCVV